MLKGAAKVEVTGADGAPLVAMTKDQPFVITVTVPNKVGKEYEPTIEAQVKTAKGTETVTLAWSTTQGGAVTYKSNPLTLGKGGEGADEISLFGELAWSWGDLSPVKFDNGATVTMAWSDADFEGAFDVQAFETQRKMIYALADAWIKSLDAFVTAILQRLKQAPDTAATRKLRAWAQDRFAMIQAYKMRINHPEFTDVERAVIASEYAQALHAGQVDMRDTSLNQRIDRLIREGYYGAYHQFLKDFAVGVYQFTLSQLPFAQSAWTIFTAKDIFGHKVDGWEYAMAVIDAASQAALLGAATKFNLDHAVGRTTKPIQREYPTAAPGYLNPVTGKTVRGDITKAPAGILVRDIEDYGMLRPQARKFQYVIDQYAAEWGHEVHAHIRPTNRDSLGPLAAGYDGKPEPIKAKSINQVDITGKWAEGGTEGTIGYYTPDKIAKALGVGADEIATRVPDPAHPGEFKWEVGKRPSHVAEDVWDRAVQRVKEYWDEKPMMDLIIAKGLAKVEGNGQIINQGISGYGLDPDTHALAVREGAQPKGIGKPLAGDPDPYMWTDGKGNALPLWKQKALEGALDQAGVKHGAITAWDPHEPKNIAIKDKILGAHAGKVDPDSGLVVGASAKAENLVIFRGRFKPRITGWGGHKVPAGPNFAKLGKAGRPEPAVGGTPGVPTPGVKPTPASPGQAAGGATGVAGEPGALDVVWLVDPATGAAWPLDPNTGQPLPEAAVAPKYEGPDVVSPQDGILAGFAGMAHEPEKAKGPPPPAAAPKPAPMPIPTVEAKPVTADGVAGVGAGTPTTAPAPPVAPPGGGGLPTWGKALLVGTLGLAGLAIGYVLGNDDGAGKPEPATGGATAATPPAAPATSPPASTPAPAPQFSLGPDPVPATGAFSVGSEGNSCGFPSSFTDSFQFRTSGGTLTITQPSTGAVASGPVAPGGGFSVEGTSRTYQGAVSGTRAEATHTYDTGSCTAEYEVVFSLDSGPVTETPASAAGDDATAPPPETGATDTPAGEGDEGDVASGTDDGVSWPAVAFGGLLLLAGAGGLLVALGKKKCSCADEEAAWAAARTAEDALLARQRAIGQEMAEAADEIAEAQKERDHWKNQLGPFEKHVGGIEQYLSQLTDLNRQLHSMTGPLVNAGSISSTPKEGWIQITDHVWAADEQAARGAAVAATLYEEVVFNGMIGPQIWKEITLTEWRISQAQKQLAAAKADLKSIRTSMEVAEARMDVAARRQNQLKQELDALEKALAAAKAETQRAFDAYQACKKGCPDG